MSNPDSSPTPKTPPSKKKTSPARNAIGLVVLVIAVAAAWSQFSAVGGYNAAVKALETRTQADEQNLMTVEEAEKLIGRAPDGPDTTSKEGGRTIIAKTYSWRGLLKSYKLTGFYVKETDIRLLRFKTEGAKEEEAAN